VMKILASRFQGRLRHACFWLTVCAVAGTAMLFLFDDSCQQDGGQHYLFARWAWVHQELFVGVWSRPLYTSIYAFPALIGYRAARALTVLICLAVSYQTWRLAEDFKIDRAPLTIALVWLQPSFFLFCADNMTEPIFALVYVIALRLHHRGRLKAGMIVASLMILARPEGFFVGALWWLWALFDQQEKKRPFTAEAQRKQRERGEEEGQGDKETRRRGDLTLVRPPLILPFSPSPSLSSPLRKLCALRASAVKTTFRPTILLSTLLLGTGAFAWWLAALAITGDPLFIKHNWPSNWPMTGTIYGAAGLYAYPIRLPEIVGSFLLPPFFYGLFHLLKHRRLYTLTSSFLLLFISHTILRAYGLLGSAGYPRYLVAISPAIALITLTGWNEMAMLFARIPRHFKTAGAGLIIAISALSNFAYADGAEWSRDARAIAAAHSWFQLQPDKPPISRLIWSHSYSCIQFDRDPWENPGFTRDRETDLKTLRESPAGTMAVWDELVGPKWAGLRAKDFEEAGFVKLYAQSFTLKGYILDRSWFGYGGPRAQTIYLLYKPKD
ncbi:MAG TPA: hypothetical protein VG324_29035, partial [Blastocatellia bacterium]|nr:hypothetical protein [Blastocatellia bacterium]